MTIVVNGTHVCISCCIIFTFRNGSFVLYTFLAFAVFFCPTAEAPFRAAVISAVRIALGRFTVDQGISRTATSVNPKQVWEMLHQLSSDLVDSWAVLVLVELVPIVSLFVSDFPCSSLY